MTDKEIIKALECCCSKKNCEENCPYFEWKKNTFECIQMSTTDAIDLINAQQAEIEMLKTQKNIYSKQFAEALDSIERLDKLNETARVDGIKEFAKRLKKSLNNWIPRPSEAIINSTVDKIVKDMVGNNK